MGVTVPLTEEEVRRIVDEESVRAAVRASSEEPKTTRRRIWKALNTPFAMWLLATVAVGALTAGYTKLEASYREAAAKRTLIRKIDNEISGRFIQIRLFAHIFETADASDKSLQKSKDIALLLPFLLNGNAGGGSLPMTSAVYPEFAIRSFFGLLVELIPSYRRMTNARPLEWSATRCLRSNLNQPLRSPKQ